jgi:hypothetical protein
MAFATSRAICSLVLPPVETKTARFTRRKPGPIIESTKEESLGPGRSQRRAEGAKSPAGRARTNNLSYSLTLRDGLSPKVVSLVSFAATSRP